MHLSAIFCTFAPENSQMANDKMVNNKYALITGAGRGIGSAIAKRLAKEGYYVLINYRSSATAAEDVLAAIQAEGGQCELMPFDVTDEQAVKAALTAWQGAHPDEYIDVLVNNAGIRKDGLLVHMDDTAWQDVMSTNLNGVFYATREVVRQMLLHRHGRIITISSVSGLVGMQGQTNYSAAKAALIGFTKSLSKEIASRKVTVNAIAPGFIQTDMTQELNADEVVKSVPMHRWGQPEEVAALVAFLASEDAGYITGQTIAIAGGL